ncbi:hypothetical protein CEUSTIGMA_g13227.t1 [Chlamydomonas eustigma]|uniref:Uncharacterized protein n=1 Tax=Chlamydomonas eustigma TaxID=1157962 RepID=A0A250XSA5_9CHLO|nr:hypothetical protein CEUSTIGMA_g13227.t1 [Chlamydomonas eustigma]|eukprot:GAX85812.1 hypothetical protein CEUSTIGMA_g13227.t1 [Chlamydomonas eustigma]
MSPAEAFRYLKSRRHAVFLAMITPSTHEQPEHLSDFPAAHEDDMELDQVPELTSTRHCPHDDTPALANEELLVWLKGVPKSRDGLAEGLQINRPSLATNSVQKTSSLERVHVSISIHSQVRPGASNPADPLSRIHAEAAVLLALTVSEFNRTC